MSSEPKLHLGDVDEAPSGDKAPITVDVERRVPIDGGGHRGEVQTYELRPANALNILGIFREIYFHHDPTFGFRNFECGRGICSTCNVMYEGRVQKGCRIPIPSGSHIRIAPQDPDRSLRDIACVVGDEADADDD